MVGIQRKFHESDGILYGTLSMPTYIEGMQAMCFEHLVRAGLTKRKVPSTPFPKEQLTLHDPHNLLTDEEVERVQKRGFRSIKGLTTWAARNCFPECKFGDSQTAKVMSRPSEMAWGHLMHMVAWMSLHKHRGIRFNSAGNKIFYATVDASNKQDPKNGLCHYGMDIMAAGGPLLSHSGI